MIDPMPGVSLAALLVSAGMLTGCALFGGTAGGQDPDELLGAPTSVETGGVELRLETYLWRDFMPISPPGGKPLIGIFRVRSADSTALPAGLAIEAGWLVNGADVWQARLTGESDPESERRGWEISRIAREGPKWEPGITVEAIVRLRTDHGEAHLLRAESQPIHRTN